MPLSEGRRAELSEMIFNIRRIGGTMPHVYVRNDRGPQCKRCGLTQPNKCHDMGVVRDIELMEREDAAAAATQQEEGNTKE